MTDIPIPPGMPTSPDDPEHGERWAAFRNALDEFAGAQYSGTEAEARECRERLFAELRLAIKNLSEEAA